MTPRDEALLAEWQLKRRMGIPASQRLNDNDNDLDLDEALRRIAEALNQLEQTK